MRPKGQRDRRARFVPDAVRIRGNYAKRVHARRDIRVVSCPSRTGINPLLVESVQSVLEVNFAVRDQAETRKMKFKLPLPRLNLRMSARVEAFLIGNHVLNFDRR